MRKATKSEKKQGKQIKKRGEGQQDKKAERLFRTSKFKMEIKENGSSVRITHGSKISGTTTLCVLHEYDTISEVSMSDIEYVDEAKVCI